MGKPVQFTISIFILILAGVVAFNTFAVYTSSGWEGSHDGTTYKCPSTQDCAVHLTVLTLQEGINQGTYEESFRVSEDVTWTNITFDGVDSPNTTLMTATIEGIDGGDVTTTTTVGITEDSTEGFELAEPVDTVNVTIEMMRGDGVAPSLGSMTLQARQPTVVERIIGLMPYQTQGMAVILSAIILGGTILWLKGV